MAFKKTYRKKTYAKKAWYNKKYSAKDIALKALKNTRYLKGLVNSEMNHVDSTITLGAAQSNTTHITAIAQGDTAATRTGNSILLRNIYLRGIAEINAAVTATTRITFALVKDKQQHSDTSPTVADVFTSNTNPESMLNLNNVGRFKVIWRKTINLSIVAGGRNCIEINKYWKLYDHVRYNGTATTDIQKNGYYLMILTSEPANYPIVSLTSRVGYHDN